MASEDAAKRAGQAFAGRRGMRQPVVGGIHTHLSVTHGEKVDRTLAKGEAEKFHYRLHRYEKQSHSHGADL